MDNGNLPALQASYFDGISAIAVAGRIVIAGQHLSLIRG